jgi:hypothetical protein
MTDITTRLLTPVSPYYGDVLTCADVAHAVGVNAEAVSAYARLRGFKLRKSKGKNVFPRELLSGYLWKSGIPRLPERPKGWKPIKALLAKLGATYTYVIPRLQKGDVRAGYTGNSIFIHPEDFDFLCSEYRSLNPLPGWILVAKVRDDVGCTKEALNQWIRRNKVVRRVYLHPTLKRKDFYISEQDAARYKDGFKVRQKRHDWRGIRSGRRDESAS